MSRFSGKNGSFLPAHSICCSLTAGATKKGAPNHGRSSNPRQGACRTAPGRRPIHGALVQAPLLHVQEPFGPGCRFWRKQKLDTRASFNCFVGDRHRAADIMRVPRCRCCLTFHATNRRRGIHNPMYVKCRRCQEFDRPEWRVYWGGSARESRKDAWRFCPRTTPVGLSGERATKFARQNNLHNLP